MKPAHTSDSNSRFLWLSSISWRVNRSSLLANGALAISCSRFFFRRHVISRWMTEAVPLIIDGGRLHTSLLKYGLFGAGIDSDLVVQCVTGYDISVFSSITRGQMEREPFIEGSHVKVRAHHNYEEFITRQAFSIQWFNDSMIQRKGSKILTRLTGVAFGGAFEVIMLPPFLSSFGQTRSPAHFVLILASLCLLGVYLLLTGLHYFKFREYWFVLSFPCWIPSALHW